MPPDTQQQAGTYDFQLWPTRSIKLSWSSGSASEGTDKVLADLQMPFLGFIRIGEGKLEVSKADFINNFIRTDNHGVFSTRHSIKCCDYPRLLDGVVDMSVFLPGDCQHLLIGTPVGILNVHGNAENQEIQLQLLKQNAFAVIVFLKRAKNFIKFLNDLSEKVGLIIVIDENYNSAAVEYHPTNNTIVVLGIKSINLKTAVELVRSFIRKRYPTEKSINDCKTRSIASIATVYAEKQQEAYVMVDEENVLSKTSKDISMSFHKLILEENGDSKHFPLQGSSWSDWCKAKKDYHRFTKKPPEERHDEYCYKLEQAMSKSREQQVDSWIKQNHHRAIDIFQGAISNCSRIDLLFTLEQLKDIIDKKTDSDFTALRTDVIKDASKTVEVHQKFTHARTQAIGLEHFFRELCQRYEAVEAFLSNNEDKVNKFGSAVLMNCMAVLPYAVAELLLSGYPVELLDGNSGHVTLTWIEAVFTRLKEKLIGDKRMYVINVLGVQSTGKSTLLNAMFGLQFPVSTGRCTKGIYMHLLQVEESWARSHHYDYVLVLDTEGLRASNSASSNNDNQYAKDNEMATFVVGLADVTIINILGETYSEVEDFLSIAVQALIRMKEVRLTPRVVFVHQNMSDIGSESKLGEGREKLKNTLDEVTKRAAQEVKTKATCFKDVIAFDMTKDCWYIPSLWHGNPPVQYPSKGYSEKIQKLRDYILSIPISQCGNITHFVMKLQDFWKALLAEDFVFNFRNTIERVAKNFMDRKLSDCVIKFRKCLHKCESQRMTLDDIEKRVKRKEEKLLEELETFVKEDPLSSVLVKWECQTKNRLQYEINQKTREVKDRIAFVATTKSIRSYFENQREEHLQNFRAKSKLFVKETHNRGDEKLCKERFTELWEECLAKVTPRRHQDRNIRADMEERRTNFLEFDALRKFLSATELIISGSSTDRRDQNRQEKQCGKKNKSDEIVTLIKNGIKSLFKRVDHDAAGPVSLPTTCTTAAYQSIIENMHQSISTVCKDNLQNVDAMERGYQPDWWDHLFVCIRDQFEELAEKGSPLDCKTKALIIVHICNDAVPRFEDIQKQFKEKTDVQALINEKKEAYWKAFDLQCKGTKLTKVAAELTVLRYTTCVEKTLKSTVIEKVKNNIQDSFDALRTKQNLLAAILEDLLQREDFKGYMEYVKNTKQYATFWIKQLVIKEFPKLDIPIVISGILRRYTDAFIKVTSEVTSSCSTSSASTFQDWWSTFAQNTTFRALDLPHTPPEEMDEALGIPASDFQDMQEFIGRSLLDSNSNNDWCERLICDMRAEQEDIVSRVSEQLFESFNNSCWEQCPFCNETCAETYQNHTDTRKHNCLTHKPELLVGWHWAESRQFCMEPCSVAVSSNARFSIGDGIYTPCKEYQTKFPNWLIEPAESCPTYWKWVICRFRTELQKHFPQYKFEGDGEIPKSWENITKESVLRTLRENGYKACW